MTQAHFQGKFEVELKFKLRDKAAFLTKLQGLEHELMLENNHEVDCYFDSPQGHLSAQQSSLCIRHMHPSNIQLWIVKGPEPERCEATRIDCAERAKSMLSTMGYVPTLTLNKTRSIYFVGKFHITLDSLKGLGDFAEFAIMTDEAHLLEGYRLELMNLAAQFDLSPAMLETRSYRQLLAPCAN